MVKENTWRTSIKCVACDKTGKIPDPNNAEKQMKCIACGGYGMIVSSGRSKAD